MPLYAHPQHTSSSTDRPLDPGRRGRRADFARQMTLSGFGWKNGKALDQADFLDHPPGELTRPSPEARL